MTDLVIAVRLKADGSGLVGELRNGKGEVLGFGEAAATANQQLQSMAGGTNSAATAAREMGAAGSQAGAAIAGMSGEMRQAAGSIGATSAASTEAANDVRQLGTATVAAGGQAQELAGDLRQAGAAAEAMATDVQQAAAAVRAAGTAQKNFGQIANDNEKSLRNQQYAIRNVGQQVGDFGLQVASGQDPARAFSQQVGQLGYAMSEMGGAAGKVGAFLTGPWGIALTIGAAVLAPFIEKLFQGNRALVDQVDKLGKAADAADSYGAAQSLLGKIVDLTTGKLKTQNQVLIQQIKLLAQANILKAQQDAKTASEAIKSSVEPSDAETALNSDPESPLSALDADRRQRTKLAPLRKVMADYNNAAVIYQSILNNPQTSPDQLNAASAKFGQIVNDTMIRVDALGKSGQLAGKNLIDTKQKVLDLGKALTDQAANTQIVGVINGDKVPDDLKPYKAPGKPKKPPKPKSTEALDEFGRDAADKIAGLREQFTDTPAAVKQTDAAIRQLNDLIDDLARKKPPNFEVLIGQAKDAERAIREGLQRPYNDLINSQQQQLELGDLIVRGHEDQAEALKTIWALEKQIGPLLPEQKDAILAGVQAMKAQERQLDILRQKQQLYLNALGDIRGVITDTIYDGFTSIKDVPAKLFDIFKRFQAQFLTEKLFGNTFRQLQDQVTGTKVVEEASYRFKDAADTAADALRRVASAANDNAAAASGSGPVGSVLGGGNGAANDNASLGSIGAAIGGGIAPLAGSIKGLDGTIGAQGDFFSVLSDNLKQLGGSIDDLADAAKGDGAAGDIVVTGRRGGLQNPSQFFGDSIGKLLKGVGISDNAAATIGKVAGKGLQGAFEGQMASGIAQMLGIKQSSTGAAIGGALGSFLPIPGGSFIGGLVGGTIGQLFAPKAKPGGVTVSNVDGSAARSGSSGSDAKLIAQSSGLGDAVASGLNDIVKQLGGKLGSFSVSIGKYKDDLRVNENGRPLGGVTGSGAKGFGDDENAAVSYAISRAIAQGAVTGLSEAVQKALKSSTDVQKALDEALKVQNLETLIGGVTAQIDKIFKDYEAEAAERLDLAKKYGLDILKVEQINAEQRADLLDQTLKSRVGSLQTTLDSLKFGDLFEGTAADRRQALLGQITAAQADAEAGKDGAADKLADLYTQLVQTSKEAFGTAGPEYTTDRSTAETGIEKVIQIETDRVNAAAAQAQATTDAVNANNALTDESNNLIAQGNGKLDTLIGLIENGGGGFSGANDDFGYLDLSLVGRSSKVNGGYL